MFDLGSTIQLLYWVDYVTQPAVWPCRFREARLEGVYDHNLTAHPTALAFDILLLPNF